MLLIFVTLTSISLVSAIDILPPTYSNISFSSTLTGDTSNFLITWKDDVMLNSCIFSTNNTGQWLNSTLTYFTANPQTAQSTMIILPAYNNTFSFIWYANDTSNNFVSTGIQSFIVSKSQISEPIPTSTDSPIPTSTILPTTNKNSINNSSTIGLVAGVIAIIVIIGILFSEKKRD